MTRFVGWRPHCLDICFVGCAFGLHPTMMVIQTARLWQHWKHRWWCGGPVLRCLHLTFNKKTWAELNKSCACLSIYPSIHQSGCWCQSSWVPQPQGCSGYAVCHGQAMAQVIIWKWVFWVAESWIVVVYNHFFTTLHHVHCFTHPDLQAVLARMKLRLVSCLDRFHSEFSEFWSLHSTIGVICLVNFDTALQNCWPGRVWSGEFGWTQLKLCGFVWFIFIGFVSGCVHRNHRLYHLRVSGTVLQRVAGTQQWLHHWNHCWNCVS